FWKRQRRLVQPAFHARRIGAYGQVMVDYANDLAQQWQDGETRAIDKDMTALTMRIIAKTLFDADVTHDTQNVGGTIRESLELVKEGFRTLFPMPYGVPTARNRHMRDVVNRLNALIQRFIDERRSTGEDKGDFLSLLLAAQDEESADH